MDRPPRVVVVHPDEASARRYADWVPEPCRARWRTAVDDRDDLADGVDVVVASDDLAPGDREVLVDAVEAGDHRRRLELVVLYGPSATLDSTPAVTASLRTPTNREDFRTVVRRRALLQQYRRQFELLSAERDARAEADEPPVAERADEILDELLEYMSVQELLAELL